MKNLSAFLILFMLLTPGNRAFAQEQVQEDEINVDDLGNASSAFKENFFNALTEKAKGNYDRAIEFLNKCVAIDSNNGAVYFELAKNELGNKNLSAAETNIIKAIAISGDREWLLDTLFDIYENKREFQKGLEVLKKLVDINKRYEEILPEQYLKLNNNNAALQALNDLEKRLGPDERRSRLRTAILSSENKSDGKEETAADIEKLIVQDPKNEALYLKLIYIYSQQNKIEALLKTAQALEANVPASDKGHLAMYKIYWDQNKTDKSLASLERIFQSDQFDDTIKTQVLTDFIKNANSKPELATKIDQIINDFSKRIDNPLAYQALGEYFLRNKNQDKALIFYEKGLAIDPNNYELVKKTVLLFIEFKEFKKAADKASESLEIFPAQSFLYLLHGVALNNLNESDKAIETLENGLTYILDEYDVERDIYVQLAKAYETKGNTSQATKMRNAAQKLNKT